MSRTVFALTLLALAMIPAHALTSYSRMTARLERDAANSRTISIAKLGRSASGSRSIWMVRVARPGIDEAKTLRVLVLCRQHGDEPASTEAALGFLDAVATGKNKAISRQLKAVTLYLVPMVNPDGADALTRVTGAGVDLNRDWLHFDAPETRAVMRGVRAIRPQVVLDMHSWDLGDTYNSTCIEMPRPGDLQTGSSAAARMSDAVGSSVVNALQRSSVAVDATSYGTDADNTLCHRYFAVDAHIPAILFETRSGPNTEPDLTRRTAIARAFLSSAMAAFAADAPLRARLTSSLAAPQAGLHTLALFAPVPPPAPPAPPAKPPVPWLVRVPRPIWYALVLYGMGTVVIGVFKPKPLAAGSVRLSVAEGRSDRRGRRIARAVYLPSAHLPAKRGPLPPSTGG